MSRGRTWGYNGVVDLAAELYLAAGLAALGLGAGTLVHEPHRVRNRLFAALCAALALWTLGVAGHSTFGGSHLLWHPAFLLGSCAAAPIGLHFIVRIRGSSTRLMPVAYGAAGLLWLSAWTPLYENRRAWNLGAMVLLGGILLQALVLLLRHTLSRPQGAERRAFRLLLIGAVIAVVGGMTDFLPRDLLDLPQLGPVALMIFLLLFCSIVVRHRFLDVDVFLARAVALLVGTAAAGLLLHFTRRLFGDARLPLYIACFVILATAGPAGRLLHLGARTLLGADDSLPRALAEASRRLPGAGTPEQVQTALARAITPLPRGTHLSLFLRGEDGRYRPLTDAAPSPSATALPHDDPLPRYFEADAEPLTRRVLQEESAEAAGERRSLARFALDRFRELDADLAAPLFTDGQLRGWMLLTGGVPETRLTAELGSALLALGNQAVEGLDRIRAQQEARRSEALATVGELAAGLAHEVRNPLAALRGAAQVLEGESDPVRFREMLQVIDEESARLGRVAGEFLDYARPGSGRREPVDLAGLAHRVARAAGSIGAGIVEVDAPTNLPAALGDPDPLHRALENLVRNAREAAGENGRVLIRLSAPEPGWVTVSVEDDGPGIPEDQIPAIFQPFHTNRPQGTGLGLALVDRVVAEHGGHIRAGRSPDLGGAALRLTLPTICE